MNKRILSTILCMSLILVLVACGNEVETNVEENQEVQVEEDSKEVIEEVEPEEESEVEEQKIFETYSAFYNVSEENGQTYFVFQADLKDEESASKAITAARTMADKVPYAVFGIGVEGANKSVLVSLENGKESLISSEGDGNGTFGMPSWYLENDDEEYVQALSKIIDETPTLE